MGQHDNRDEVPAGFPGTGHGEDILPSWYITCYTVYRVEYRSSTITRIRIRGDKEEETRYPENPGMSGEKNTKNKAASTTGEERFVPIDALS